MTVDNPRRARMLRRDAALAQLVAELTDTSSISVVDAVLSWAAARDAERRSLAEEALERYRELNLLYDLAERSASLEPTTIVEVATGELSRLCRRGASMALLIDEDQGRVRLFDTLVTPLAGIPADGFVVGQGIIGRVAAAGDGEIVNDPTSDPRATPVEAGLGALMVAPLRAGDRRLGVLLVCAPAGSEFTAGEHRMLSAVAALTAPALDAALRHVRTLALARAREAELEQQLAVLRSEVEARRREERVNEITGTDYFRSLRDQADEIRRGLEGGSRS